MRFGNGLLLLKSTNSSLLSHQPKFVISRLMLSSSPATSLPAHRNYCTGGDLKPQHAWRKPWIEREGEWYSTFNLFAPTQGGSPDMIRFLQQDIDFRPSTIKNWWNRRKEGNKLYDQRYIFERHQILGNDLATAHFIVHRGGAVRFSGSPLWVRKDEDDEYTIPDKYIPDVCLDAVDASGMDLYYEGLANIVGLKKLKLLNLRGCRLIDDWCLDRIAGEHCNTVEVLNISECPLITDRGLAILTRMKKLKELHIEGIADTPSAKLVCLLLEDLNSKLKIYGTSYSTIQTEVPTKQP